MDVLIYKSLRFNIKIFSKFLILIQIESHNNFFTKRKFPILFFFLFKMQKSLWILSKRFIIFMCLLVTVNSLNQIRSQKHKRDAEENEHHLLNILKDHEIIPDIIDDASHADTLEVN